MRKRQTRAEELNALLRARELAPLAVLNTVSADGGPHARPVVAAPGAGDPADASALWLYCRIGSGALSEIARNRRVNVALLSRRDSECLVAAGQASLLQDRRRMRELWSPELERWFPTGVDDPDLYLLRVEVAEVEGWHGEAPRRSAFRSLRAAFSRDGTEA